MSKTLSEKTKKDSTSSTNARSSREVRIELDEAKFKRMLLNALSTDDEVRNSVAMILRSRETDVFSAVVQSLEKDNVRHRIGNLLFIYVSM